MTIHNQLRNPTKELRDIQPDYTVGEDDALNCSDAISHCVTDVVAGQAKPQELLIDVTNRVIHQLREVDFFEGALVRIKTDLGTIDEHVEPVAPTLVVLDREGRVVHGVRVCVEVELKADE